MAEWLRVRSNTKTAFMQSTGLLLMQVASAQLLIAVAFSQAGQAVKFILH
jgi:hypothetical protein